MKKRFSFRSFNLKQFLVLLLSASLLFNGAANAQKKKKKKKKKPEYEVDISVGATYDDNILKYSDKYIDRFLNREDEGRFHIETLDDVIMETSAELTAKYRIFKKRNSEFNGKFSRQNYLKNNIKSWNSYNIGYKQYLTKKASFKISYSYIPDFYVRHFRDKQWVNIYGYKPISFQPYAFAKENIGFWIQNKYFKNTRIMLTFDYARYLHNKHFTEYDCNNITTGVNIYQQLNKKLRLDFGYKFTNSDAKGYDASFETEDSKDGPDATYIEDQFSIGAYWKMPKIFKKYNTLDLECRFNNRYYRTDLPLEIDPLHAGRFDENFRLYTTYKIKLSKTIDLKAFYNWYFRDTDTKAEINREDISDEKDYRQIQTGLEVIYSFGL